MPATLNPFPIEYVLKVNSPELEAIFAQYGKQTYVDAEEINNLFQAVNFLYENIPTVKFIPKGDLLSGTTVMPVANETHIYIAKYIGTKNGVSFKTNDIVAYTTTASYLFSNNNQGTVKTVNSISPDGNGNVVIPLATETNIGLMGFGGVQNFYGTKIWKMLGSSGNKVGFNITNSDGVSAFKVTESSDVTMSGVFRSNGHLLVNTIQLYGTGTPSTIVKNAALLELGQITDNSKRLRINVDTGNVSIGGIIGTDTTEKLEVFSTTSGAVIAPRMTQAQKTAIVGPKVGSMVTQTDGTVGIYTYTPIGWKRMLIEA